MPTLDKAPSQTSSWLARLSRHFILQVVLGIVTGAILGCLAPEIGIKVGFLGDLYIEALKAIAPSLVFVLVVSSLMQQHASMARGLRTIVLLYLVGTFLAGLLAVTASFIFPSTLILKSSEHALSAPQHLGDVLHGIMINALQNPVTALTNGNYIAILLWSVGLGIALRQAHETTRQMMTDLSRACSVLVRAVIRCSPLGVFGLVAAIVSQTGISTMAQYLHLLLVLVGCMAFVALVINPIIVAFILRRNPYPLVFMCLKEAGITAFFTRSSAANIPVNLEVCRRLNLNESIYRMSIPVGANISMSGAVTTITVLTLATVHTQNIQVDMVTALLLSIIATVAALGASGIAGGSLLLIPLACSLFGISSDIAMQVVAAGFIIGVVQDSTETALNSSTDLLFTVAVCQAEQERSSDASANGGTAVSRKAG